MKLKIYDQSMNEFANGIDDNKILSGPFELHAFENGLEFVILFFKGFQFE